MANRTRGLLSAGCGGLGVLALSGCARLLALHEAPRAILGVEDTPIWACVSPEVGCGISGVVHNLGTGCAISIRATVRFVTPDGTQRGDLYQWALPAQQILEPRDHTIWRVDFVPLDDAHATSPVLDIAWVNTPCNVGAGWLGLRHR